MSIESELLKSLEKACVSRLIAVNVTAVGRVGEEVVIDVLIEFYDTERETTNTFCGHLSTVNFGKES